MNRRLIAAVALGASASALALIASTLPASGRATQVAPAIPPTTFTVVAADGVDAAVAKQAINAAGGSVVSSNPNAGSFQVVTTSADFARKVADARPLVGAVPRRAIGNAPVRRALDPIERENLVAGPTGSGAEKAPARRAERAKGLDPLDDKLWGLKMVRSDLARQKQAGKRKVTVGILDTGLDASNPDLAKNFDATLSRNFAPDIEAIDGPCEARGCVDPVGTDDGGHGTHVAGSVAAAADGFGLSGVAPNVTLVQLKGGQDSGFFFLDPVINSITYAADAGIDVLNMSFYVDPWAFNCPNNPADSPEFQAQQRATIKAVNRALKYAHFKGVTLVGALGNSHLDLAKPGTDTSSPNYPAASAYPRVIDNATCVDLPVEGAHVIGVSALGPSSRKADFSNYGTEQISVSAPGGYYRDGFGTPTFQTPENMILSTYPKKALQEEGAVDADGNVLPAKADEVFKQCTTSGQCGYYTYLQGTSMASPYAAGVAALIVSQHGTKDQNAARGLTMDPKLVEQHLYRTAAGRPCPTPRTVSYKNEGRDETWDATCEGAQSFNGFYGHGIVDAYAAVTKKLAPTARP
ncbi:S8 family serine peptidase [Pilimelia columellifera]|uniref:S8 family serine peptidase n=1 Tax=Pilimelia columellifera subsp. columellifera TaxID=706583 RepID=A0ABP6B1Q5_9ACTN